VRSRVGFGAMDLSEPPRDDARGRVLLLEAADRGVALIDTADRYGRGHNEDLIGRVLRDRSDVAIGTKIGFVGRPGDEAPVDSRPEHLHRAARASLDRLQRDHVEVLLLHRVDPRIPFAESLGALEELRARGLARRIGVSEVGPVTLAAMLDLVRLDVVQIEYSIVSRQPGDELVDLAAYKGMEVHASSPLAVGMLSGDSTRWEGGEADHRRLAVSPRLTDANREHNLRLLAAVHELASASGCSVPALSLSWLLAQGPHVVPLPGTTDPRHLRANLAVAEQPCPSEVVERLDRLLPAGALAGARKPDAAIELSLP
jgi:aryl-alcohol dehydrogenase-like predicted oxidoreductase